MGKSVNKINANETTLISGCREKPEDLFHALVQAGTEVSSKYPSVYYLRGNTTFPTQIIVTKELLEGIHYN